MKVVIKVKQIEGKKFNHEYITKIDSEDGHVVGFESSASPVKAMVLDAEKDRNLIQDLSREVLSNQIRDVIDHDEIVRVGVELYPISKPRIKIGSFILLW